MQFVILFFKIFFALTFFKHLAILQNAFKEEIMKIRKY